MRILVVDDHRDSADALAWLLQSNGHEAFAAYDGPSALLAAERHAPEAIIQDLGMPDMSGYEVARRIRRLCAARKVLLVAATGRPDANAFFIAREAGFDRILLKPIGLTALEEVLAPRAAARP